MTPCSGRMLTPKSSNWLRALMRSSSSWMTWGQSVISWRHTLGKGGRDRAREGVNPSSVQWEMAVQEAKVQLDIVAKQHRTQTKDFTLMHYHHQAARCISSCGIICISNVFHLIFGLTANGLARKEPQKYKIPGGEPKSQKAKKSQKLTRRAFTNSVRWRHWRSESFTCFS